LIQSKEFKKTEVHFFATAYDYGMMNVDVNTETKRQIMKQVIPTFSMARQTQALRPKLMDALQNIVDTQQFIGGAHVDTFEKNLAAYLGVQFAIACNSGTDALWMALFALNNVKDSIVLTTPFSFIASSSEIVAFGAHPVFIDIEPDTFNIDPILLAEWLKKNAVMKNGKAVHQATGLHISGIIPVDLFGQCADYEKFHAIAEQWNLWIIEDTAQALGASINGQKAGTFGNIGAISFYPTKNLGAFGDAGACVTNDPQLAERLNQLRHHGRKNAYEYNFLGINSRMDTFQAALLTQKLPHLDGWNKRRAEIAQRYADALKEISWLQLPTTKIGTHVFHQYSIMVGHGLRGDLEKHLANDGVQTRIFYPQVLPAIPFLQTHPALATAIPVAEMTTQSILALPMWPELEDSEIDYVVSSIKKFAESVNIPKVKTWQASTQAA